MADDELLGEEAEWGMDDEDKVILGTLVKFSLFLVGWCMVVAEIALYPKCERRYFHFSLGVWE